MLGMLALIFVLVFVWRSRGKKPRDLLTETQRKAQNDAAADAETVQKQTAWLPLRRGASDGGAAAPQEPVPEMMEGLILALSKQEDSPRRQRVAEMFGLALAGVGVGDQPPEFATNFQIALDKVGSEVQELARKKVRQEQEQGLAASEEFAPEEGKYVPRVKRADELQVWALIDMMVQSKLLVSRATRPDSKPHITGITPHTVSLTGCLT
jgi:hypothetical protein